MDMTPVSCMHIANAKTFSIIDSVRRFSDSDRDTKIESCWTRLIWALPWKKSSLFFLPAVKNIRAWLSSALTFAQFLRNFFFLPACRDESVIDFAELGSSCCCCSSSSATSEIVLAHESKIDNRNCPDSSSRIDIREDTWSWKGQSWGLSFDIS